MSEKIFETEDSFEGAGAVGGARRHEPAESADDQAA
jgi:hypothetical protein